MLTLSSVRVLIGGKPVLENLSMTVETNEIVALIGAPGCGKSTLLHSVFGLARVAEGSIEFDGEQITNRSPRENIRRGLALVAQGGRVFRGLSVEENLYLGGCTLDEARTRERVAAICELFPRLKERRIQAAGSLSGGERQMLALGMGLVPQPRLLLLDEPSTGLSPLMTETLLGEIKSLAHKLRCTILVVEQNVKNATLVSDRVMVLRRGRISHIQRIAGNEDIQALLDAYAFERTALG
jgi:branched-chain amino acid transport system ATP-binding protein